MNNNEIFLKSFTISNEKIVSGKEISIVKLDENFI